jgi:hypothetical protein
MGVPGCATMVSTMVMQPEQSHCCPLHVVWWPAAVWNERAHSVCAEHFLR